MKKFTNKEYQIYENLAQAKSILRKNDGSIEDDEFLQIVDATNKDGWTGLLTRLVYEDGVDVDEVVGFYPDLKKSKLDLGKLNKMSYDDIIDAIYDESNDSNDGVEFVARSENYLIFHVKTFEDGLKICSPSWCLKTKSHWDDYTSNGYQFVIIDEQYANKRGKTKLLTPSSAGYFGSYGNIKNPKIRYGISIKSSSNIKVFNDNNISIPIEKIPPGILKEINIYLKSGKVDIFKKNIPTNEFEYVKDEIKDFLEEESEVSGSWDGSVHATMDYWDNYEDMFTDFVDFMAEYGIDMYEFYRKYRTQIIDDNWLTHCCGALDYILYRLSGNLGHDEGGIPLSGMFLSEREFSANSYKYIYGFAQNKYGKMYILQSFSTLAEWYEYMLLNFDEIFLDEGYTSYVAYDNIPPMEHLSEWIPNLGGIIQEFFNINVKISEDFVSIDFYIDQFIETMKNWMALKKKMIVDETYNDKIFKVFGNRSVRVIDYEELTIDLVNLSKYTSPVRIINFIQSLDDESIYSDDDDFIDVNGDAYGLDRSDVVKFFENLFELNKNVPSSTSVEIVPNNNSKEKSEEVLSLKFWYRSIK